MKKITHKIIITIISIFTYSCGDFDINGDLDGMWHLRTVETLFEGHSVTSIKEECVYYSIQQNLITVKRLSPRNNTEKYKQYIGRFTHTSDSLIFHNFRVYQNEDIAATAESLAPFYLDGTVSRYAIKRMNSNEMILRSKFRELTFKKF